MSSFEELKSELEELDSNWVEITKDDSFQFESSSEEVIESSKFKSFCKNCFDKIGKTIKKFFHAFDIFSSSKKDFYSVTYYEKKYDGKIYNKYDIKYYTKLYNTKLYNNDHNRKDWW